MNPQMSPGVGWSSPLAPHSGGEQLQSETTTAQTIAASSTTPSLTRSTHLMSSLAEAPSFGQADAEPFGGIAREAERPSFEPGREIYNSETYTCSTCGESVPSERDGSDYDGNAFNSLPLDLMVECEHFGKGCNCLVHPACALEGLCLHCAARSTGSKLESAVEDSLYDYQVMHLAADAQMVAENLAKDAPSKHDEQRLAQLKEAKGFLERAISVQIAKLDRKGAQPLPFSVAA